MATNNQEECTRLRLVLAPVLPLLCSCYRACYPPFLFREMPILWASSAEKRSNFLFFTGTPRRKTLEMQTAVALSQNWRVEKGHRPAPTRRQNEPEDSSVMAVVKQQPRNRNQRFAKTKPTDDPLVITVCYPRFVVISPPLGPRRRLCGAGARKSCVTERTSLAPALIYNHVDGAARGTIR